MDVINLSAERRTEWDGYILQHPKSIAWQSYDWSSVVGKLYRIAFFPLAAVNASGDIRGILPLYRVPSLRGKAKLISVPYAVAGGILSDTPDVEHLLLQKAVETMRQMDCDSLTLKQYRFPVEGDLSRDENFYNRELDLSQGPDRIWQNLADENKAAVAKADEKRLIVEFPSQDLNGFFDLLLQHHRHAGVPCVSKKWIETLVDFHMYSIALLRRDGRPVVGTMVKEFKQTVSFPFSAIWKDMPEYYDLAYYLYWHLIKNFAAEGKEIFHSGRIPNNDATYPFRLGWGGQKHRYFYQYYPNRQRRTEYTSKRGKKKELFGAVWKRLPLGLTQWIGPAIVKYFP